MTHTIEPTGVSLSDTDERARAAVRAFRAMQPTLTAFARVLTRNNSVRVQMNKSTNGMTDGKVIYYQPPIELGDRTAHARNLCEHRDADQILLCPACAIREQVLVVIYHEISHIAYDSFAKASDIDIAEGIRLAVAEHGTKYADKIREAIQYQGSNYLRIAATISPYMQLLQNAFEDARIESRMFDQRPGTKRMFAGNVAKVFRDGVQQLDGTKKEWRDYPLNTQAVFVMYLKAAGYEWQHGVADKIVADLGSDPVLDRICFEVRTARSAATVFGLAFRGLARLRELGYCLSDKDPEDEPEPEEPQDEPDQPDSQPPQDPEDEPGAPSDADEDVDGSEDGGDQDPSDSDEVDDEDSDSDGDDSSDAEAQPGTDAGDDESEPPSDGGDSDSADSGGPGDPGSSDDADPGDESTGDDDSAGPAGVDDDGPSEPGEPGPDSSTDESSGGESASDLEVDDDGNEQAGEGSGEGVGGGGDPRGSDEADKDSDGDRSEDRSGGNASDGEGDERDADAHGGDVPSTEQSEAADGDGVGSGDDRDDDAVGREADAVPESTDSEPVDEGQDADAPATSDDVGSGTPGSSVESSHVDAGDDDEGSPSGDADRDSTDSAGEPSSLGGDSTSHQDADIDSTSSEEGPAVSPLVEVEADDDTEIDTGADTGEGGTSIRPNDTAESTEYEYGDEDEAKAALLKWLDHEEKPITAEVEAGQKAIDKAIIQGIYFETPSSNVYGVREHRWGSPVMTDDGRNVSRAWEDRRYLGHGDRATGKDADTETPESLLGPALLKMRRAFSDNARGGSQRNLKSGKISARALGRRAWSDDERLFHRNTQPGKRDYVVMIMMDISGSTVGTNIKIMKQAVMAQANLCQRMGIKFAIYAQTGNLHNGRSYAQGVDLDIYHIKDVDEPWAGETQARLSSIGPDAANLDGHALEYIRKQIDTVHATDKIILYYSDGKMPAENHDEELEILQREIKTCRSKRITLLGVGIRTDSPSAHGLETVQLDSLDDIGKVVEQLGKHLLANAG